MLQTPDTMTNLDPKLREWALEFEIPDPEVLEPGVVIMPGLNYNDYLWGFDNNPPFYMQYPDFEDDAGDYTHSYGVCDNPQQFLDKFKAVLIKDPRPLCVCFSHIPKCPGEEGGWRWHKWGDYIGTGTPQCEYLSGEVGFEDGVYVYSICQLSGPEIKSELRKRLDASMAERLTKESNA